MPHSPKHYSPITSIDSHTIRITEAAYHISQQMGNSVERILAEWVIERESLFSEVKFAATPIIDRVRGQEPGGRFDKEHVGGVQRRWVFWLREVIARGSKISDWRLDAERPLELSVDERHELDRARAVVTAVHRWLHVDEQHALTLSDVERDIAVTMREYDPETMLPEWRLRTLPSDVLPSGEGRQ